MLACHKWHAIGSKAAVLWTDIDFAHQGGFAPVLLIRSLGAPIRLYGRLDEDNMLSTVITDNGARISELDLWVGTQVSHPTPVLQSILAVDMPQVRVLSLFREGYTGGNGLMLIADANVRASFPVLKAMLLEGFLFVPTHALPQLTHLHLAWLDEIDPSSILDLLRNTPALEVLDIIQSRESTAPQALAMRRSSVILPRLHSASIWALTMTTVRSLMTRLEVPNLASLRLSAILAKSGALLSTPLIPASLAARTPVNRLAFDMLGNFATFCAAFYGADLSFSMHINAGTIPDPAETSTWTSDDLPAILPLSAVDELHFGAELWPGVGELLLLRLAAHMPAVSTLVIKHNQGHSSDEDTVTDGLMHLARAVAALLANEVLFPRLAHLELVVGDIPHGFCDLLVPTLAQRDLGGRRLRRLCIRVDDLLSARWAMKWMGQAKPDYRETSIREHVDSVSIGETKKKRGHAGEADEEPTKTLGWGQWKDCVQPARHDYWRE
ncbi:hypothetical protein V8D89_004180 [Ganoderma adspersum]